MAKLVILFGFLGLCWQVRGEENKYDNNTLKLTPHNEQHVPSAALPGMAAGSAVPQRSPALNDTAARESPARAAPEDFAQKTGMPVDYKHNHSRNFIRSEKNDPKPCFDLYNYHSYENIIGYLKQVGSKGREVATVEQVLVTPNGKREIHLVKISTNRSANNPIIFIDAGLHGHEWVAISMALYIIHELTTDIEARYRELKGVDWYIMPLVNPDGYEYTRSDLKKRLWAKSRAGTTKDNCLGVNLNKNFDYEWGTTGCVHEPCDMDYCGRAKLSSTEGQKMVEVWTKIKKRMKFYVSLHAYGNYLLYPWGYSTYIKAPTWKKLHILAEMASDAVQGVGGRPFRVASAGSRFLYSGSSDDYAYGKLQVPYVYRMKLTDGFEFAFPAKRLQYVLPQYYEAFRVFAKQIRVEFNNERE